MRKILYFIWIVWVSSCTSYSPDIEKSLRYAGKNRKELEKVLKHYNKNDGDSLKLRAATFLIVNMPGKYSEYYNAPWNDVATAMLRWTSSSNKQLVLDTYKLGEKIRKADIKSITADFLINNIELSFKVWQEMPWGKDISFDVFCEEILPYRVGTEPLENWREKVLASFADIYQIFIDDTTGINTVEACRIVNDILPKFKIDKDFPSMSFTQLMASTRGTCENMVALALFVMRGMGIPVTHDFSLLQYGFPTGHAWNSINDGHGSYLSFMSTEANPGEWHMGKDIYKAKVYRRTYANQKTIIFDKNIIPPLLHRVNQMVDVTDEYNSCRNITIPVLNSHSDKTKHAFLAIYHRKQWQPIGWGVVDGDSMRFQSVQSGLYMPTYYQNGALTPAAFPFYVDIDDNSLHFLRPDTIHTVRLTGIDQVNFESGFRMKDAVFEIANQSDFSDAIKIHTIKTIPEPYFQEVTLKPSSEYRYIRLLAPPRSRCAVTLLEFFDENNEKILGKAIGTPGISGTTIDNVFDSKMETFFITDTVYSWVGLDFGKPRRISKIRYLPLIDWNGIYEDHVYELFYYDGKDWVSIGNQTGAGNHELKFNAPVGAMLLLENITRDRINSKPFYMQNGIQKWIRCD